MKELGQVYELVDEKDILAFLERHPDVAPLLVDIRSNIRRFFGEDPVQLQMSYDFEWPEDDPTLIVNILTCLDSQEALHQCRQFNRDWWIEKLEERIRQSW